MTATEWTPTLEDFENWTDDDEQSALDAIASRMKIRHIIKNDEYWALAPGGVIYKLPMFLSIHDFEALSSAADDSESIEQIKRILTQFAGEEQAKKLEDGPTQIAFNLLQDYGATLMKIQGVELGKSQDSAEPSAPKKE